MAKRRIALLLALILLALCAPALADLPPTLPPAPPVQPPTQPPAPPTPAPWIRPEGHPYPFPTEVEGYTFVSFSRDVDTWQMDAYELAALAIRDHFPEVYPGCRTEQLRDFVILPDEGVLSNMMFAEAAGLETMQWFRVLTLMHPLISNARFSVLVSVPYACAFFTDAPWMADELAAYEQSPVTWDDALSAALRIYTAHFADSGLPAPSEEEIAALRIDGGYVFSHNEDERLWELVLYEPQSPYPHENAATCVLDLGIDADTGEVIWEEWYPVTDRDRFFGILGL